MSCEKDSSPSVVTDIDGNIYLTVELGDKLWMAENLKTTRFSDGTEIRLISKNQDWLKSREPAFSWYNNDSSLFRDPYGALYNGYAATDDRICPLGWHVPSAAEIKQLISALGDSLTAGGKLKTEGLAQWHYPNTGADNSSGFTALPAGLRYFEGTYSSLSYFTAFWTSTEADTSSCYFLGLSYLDALASVTQRQKKNGFSIRCVRD
ncbi:MAG TPA: fibrobacter succinogenes major paralogous domain-containing protein [Bacteroidales bacterium]|nr:fibrobacter succinogenes major paralogous domain-containing protein [Bacteroidales bacterium]